MNKQEFLERLGELLSCLPAEKIAESQAFYAEAIADRIEEGMTEQEAIADLGSPDAAAETILDELAAVPRLVAKTKRKSTVLLWVLAIAGSPVWIPLALAFLAIALTVYLAIWALAASVWLLAAALMCALPLGVALAVVGVAGENLPYAIAQAGLGITGFGLGLLCLNMALGASRQLARLSRVWLRKMASPFKRSPSDSRNDDPRAPHGAPSSAALSANTL